ncbi:MAG: excinuclease ABC subunit UvrA [Candidatus Firestonebacteria bacterium]|nr:excinuclease ABC subunit UvrA [Candidatus Firestonebacteria bacterium]
MSEENIVIKGASQHNLKHINVTIPRNKLVVITGLSGSGKSSLAFDTIYAEGQRRYVESLSTYARQFLGQMDKPEVEFISGLSPAISIEQKTTNKNPRSTVGTVTEIYDYLRLLFARIGKPHCYSCGREISHQSAQEIVDKILERPENTRIQILAPAVRGRKGEYRKILDGIRKEGYLKIRINKKFYDLEEDDIKLDKNKKHTLEVVIDRLIIKSENRTRISESVEKALMIGDGILIVIEDNTETLFSEKYACVVCGISIEEITPRMFSFNSPYGACPECSGLGEKMFFDPDRIVPYKDLSLNQGAIKPWSRPTAYYFQQMLKAVAKHYDFNMETPWKYLPPKIQNILLYGTGEEKMKFVFENENMSHEHYTKFEGIVPHMERRYKETQSQTIREEFQNYMNICACPLCKGNRLKPEALSVTIRDKNIIDVTRLSIKELMRFFIELKLSEKENLIAKQILKEIKNRLGFLNNVGLNYLTLDRTAGTLSGGESQRIRLATQIGSRLVGVLYILDEPSIGLHQRDNTKLLNTLKELRDIGNTVLVVEHDEETILSADYILDLGPGAGENGGYVVFAGFPREILECKESITGQYLSRKLSIKTPETRRVSSKKFLEIKGARQNNLKNIDIKIPVGLFTCITGVSGSGKSTLINDILFNSLMYHFYRSRVTIGEHDKISGKEYFDKVIDVDQSPIGRTPRSNPVTYTGVFAEIRKIFTLVPEAKIRGYKDGRFSFNVKGGRCEACEGDGIIKIEMHFLPDVYVPCEVCGGKRYNLETLEIKYKGKNIAEVLDMTVEEALAFFKNIPRIKSKLKTIYDVGLGYIKLGQPATTLSGGEAQRIKLSNELAKRSTGRTLYLLDEPTTGLHFADISKLLIVLNQLADSGNTIIVIEHNLDVIKTADYIIDLGPEGGDMGGYVVACGTPEEIVESENSYTGQYLKNVL